MRKVTWDDLTINAQYYDLSKVYADWLWLLEGRIKPLMITKFGDMFFQRTDGKVSFLDTVEGRVVSICDSENEFITYINKQENIENYLFSYLVFDLVNQGKIPGDRQSYSFTSPPILGGKIDLNNISIMDFEVNVSLSGQLHKQVKDLPEGARISEFKFIE